MEAISLILHFYYPTGSLAVKCKKKKEKIIQGSLRVMIWIHMHRLIQGTFRFPLLLTPKCFFFCLLFLSLIKLIISAWKLVPTSFLHIPHTDATLVHALSLKTLGSFIGHEVHCFNFPSLQVYAERENIVVMLSEDKVLLLNAVKDETHDLLPAAPALWTLTFVPLPFHFWPFVNLLPLKILSAEPGLKIYPVCKGCKLEG